MGSSLGGQGNEHVLYILFAIVAGLSALSLSTIQDLSVSDTHPDQDKRDATSEPGVEGMVEAATWQPARFAKYVVATKLILSTRLTLPDSCTDCAAPYSSWLATPSVCL